jgi:hypothetical protein
MLVFKFSNPDSGVGTLRSWANHPSLQSSKPSAVKGTNSTSLKEDIIFVAHINETTEASMHRALRTAELGAPQRSTVTTILIILGKREPPFLFLGSFPLPAAFLPALCSSTSF